jgi:phosphoribosylanthranilate isomerase
MLIKVCGLRIPEQIDSISKISDFVGFIYYSKSPRFVSNPPKNSGAKRVGVFVNESPEKILEIIERDQLDAVQLHGNESPNNIAILRYRITVIKAFGVSEKFNFNSLHNYEGTADYYLFDTKTAKHGGSGQQFNWKILNQYKLSTPFFLSGGITHSSIERIRKIENSAFAGVDINSGFEIGPGNKNVKLIKHFIDGIKNN